MKNFKNEELSVEEIITIRGGNPTDDSGTDVDYDDADIDTI